MSYDPLTTDVEATEAEVERLRAAAARLRAAVARSIQGYEDEVELVLLSIFAGGHVLLEGAPGLGKTTLVRAVAAALALDFRRIQFTPDLMPGDIVGTRLLQEDDSGTRRFTFERGPVFAHVVLADEINRATPRTQSALLEAMQEGQVTVFGDTLRLDDPFTVIATENPIEMEGTYPLPEAQLDRFLTKIRLAAPTESNLIEILRRTTGAPEELPQPAVSREDVLGIRALVREVPVSQDILRLVARTVQRCNPAAEHAPEDVRRFVRYGASPRGGQAVLLLAKAHALIHGRLHVAREDVERVCCAALRHRLVLGFEGEAHDVDPDGLIEQALAAAGQ